MSLQARFLTILCIMSASSAFSQAGDAGAAPATTKRPFGDLFKPRLVFGSPVEIPGCTMEAMTGDAPCLTFSGKAVFSDRPYVVKPDGPNKVLKPELSFLGLIVLSRTGFDFKKGELLREQLTLTLSRGLLTRVELTQPRKQVDEAGVVEQLNRRFGPAQTVTEDMIDPSPSAKHTPEKIAKLPVTTYRWTAPDSTVALQCHAACKLSAEALK